MQAEHVRGGGGREIGLNRVIPVTHVLSAVYEFGLALRFMYLLITIYIYIILY